MREQRKFDPGLLIDVSLLFVLVLATAVIVSDLWPT